MSRNAGAKTGAMDLVVDKDLRRLAATSNEIFVYRHTNKIPRVPVAGEYTDLLCQGSFTRMASDERAVEE